MKVAITGSSGLIGRALTASLQADGHEVVRLVRRAPLAAGEARWDPRAADAGVGGDMATTPLRGVGACVHLAGAGVGDHRWTSSYKAEIRASRVLATRALAAALTRLDPPPRVLVAASAIGRYGDTGGRYGDTGGRDVTEDAPPGDGFLPRLVRDWEAAAGPAAEAGIRTAHVRSGLVLNRSGGVLARLALPARLGLLPRFGDGSQAVSWISLTDEVRAIRFLLDDDGQDGPFNLTAPNPVTNDELTAALHNAFGRPDFRWLRVPAPLLRLALGEMSSELLTSVRVAPRRLAAAGFEFRYPTLSEALAAELRG
ncbi:MAG: TIGR01777 family oxidoreductase [Nocardiopsaceae bacterium]|nr:TIGR01777 family oxidoreductase [Nocardiopsaceae bacterium]